MLKAPFPWFGGKSRVAHLVWEALGDVPNYVEPFFGSGAVLLARPEWHTGRVETANDKDACIANFWRAVLDAPEEVASWADYPVSEVDLHARHRWLVEQLPTLRERLREDPHCYDAKVAGWWVWGISQWIGSGWCSQPAWDGRTNAGRAGRAGRGVHARRVRDLGATASIQKRPQLGRGGRGVHRHTLWEQRPDLSGSRGAAGRGVLAVGARGGVYEWMRRLAERLRYVRVCCGDFRRVLSPSATVAIGVTGVLLDPPYSADADRDPSIYGEEDLEVAHEARKWALVHGEDPRYRIALCGYEGEHKMPATWRCVAWEASGGYAAAAGNKDNARRERIWFSPHCLKPSLGALFDAAGGQ